MNYQRFKNALREHGKVSLIDSLIVLGISNPAAIVSELRSKYGDDSILTEHEIVKTLQGNPFKCRVYRLSASGREKMFPVKKDFPSWILETAPKQNKMTDLDKIMYSRSHYERRTLPLLFFTQDYSVKNIHLFLKGEEYTPYMFNYERMIALMNDGILTSKPTTK